MMLEHRIWDAPVTFRFKKRRDQYAQTCGIRGLIHFLLIRINTFVPWNWISLSSRFSQKPEKTSSPPIGASFSDDHKQPPFDEEKALNGLKTLDPQAVTAIHTHYYPDIYRYARYHLDDPHIAEDIAADVFMRLLEAVNAGKGPRTTLRGWLMATVSNMVNDHFRKKYRRKTEELSDEMQADTPGLLSMLEGKEQHKHIRAALGKLTPDQQNILALRFGSGYSLEQTAEAIGKKVNAVKQLQFRALASLRRYLGDV